MVAEETCFYILKLCLTFEDFLVLTLNLIVIAIVIISFYTYKLITKKNSNLASQIKNNFTYLGEGTLGYFYTELNMQQKGSNQKKRMPQKQVYQIQGEKNNTIKCNHCGQNFNISYQYL